MDEKMPVEAGKLSNLNLSVQMSSCDTIKDASKWV